MSATTWRCFWSTAATATPEDTVVVSETVSLLLTGRSLPADAFWPRWDARLLVRFVRPHDDTLGLSVPTKVQWVLDTVGRPRIYGAALAAAVTGEVGAQGTSTGSRVTLHGRSTADVRRMRTDCSRRSNPLIHALQPPQSDITGGAGSGHFAPRGPRRYRRPLHIRRSERARECCVSGHRNGVSQDMRIGGG